MVAEYDNDDIVEDYEVIGEDGDADEDIRQVDSAGGGPVKRPSKSVRPNRPPTTAMPTLDEDGNMIIPPAKGQISQKKAKMIWYVSIGVSVLCLAAIGASIALKEDKPKTNTVEPSRASRYMSRPVVELSPKEKAMKTFSGKVIDQRRRISLSKAYDFFMISQSKWATAKSGQNRTMRDYQKEATDENEKLAKDASAKAISAWYDARYAYLLFISHNDPNNVEMEKNYMTVDMKDKGELSSLQISTMEDLDIIKFQAAYDHLKFGINKIRKWKTDGITKHLIGAIVFDDPKYQEMWKEAKERWSNAQKDEFLQEDLEFVSGEPYKAPSEMKYNKLVD